MGASDSKLVFKKGIFRLSEERHIPADDAYWTSVSGVALALPAIPGTGLVMLITRSSGNCPSLLRTYSASSLRPTSAALETMHWRIWKR